MACSFCLTDGIPNIASAGQCTACGRDACTHPSGRNDQRFHGRFCSCACNLFVCRRHYRSHSSTHPGGALVRCFPAPTAAASGATLAILERQLGPAPQSELPPHELDVVGDFLLNFAAGSDEVRAAIVRGVGIESSIDDLAEDEPARRLGPLFADPTSLSVLALSAIDLLVHSWPNLDAERDLPEVWLGLDDPIRALSEFPVQGLTRSGWTIFPSSPRPVFLPLGPARAAYAKLSPRIATALGALRPQHVSGSRFLQNLVEHRSTVISNVGQESISREPAGLEALLPQPVRMLAGATP